VLQQEGRLDEVMRQEIRQLRVAHEVVNSLVFAEEGRAVPFPRPSDLTTVDAARVEEAMPVPLSRTNSLPDYRSEAGSSQPPPYEEDQSEVVDGFREYTPSTTTVWTEQSSVLDISPRLSLETLREAWCLCYCAMNGMNRSIGWV